MVLAVRSRASSRPLWLPPGRSLWRFQSFPTNRCFTRDDFHRRANLMDILKGYLRQYWKLILLALVLAATNQVFSLLDPLIFRHVIDSYATRFKEYTTGQFVRGVSFLLFLAVSVAFIARVAKNFQDYFVNVIVQRLGAQMYSDGIR